MTKKTGLTLLTVPETADRLRCSTDHVYRLIGAGHLRSVQLRASGKKSKTRIREDDLDAFVEARTQPRGGGTT